MLELALSFWCAVVFNLLVLVFGTLHHRIDLNTNRFYNGLLLLGTIVMVCSGVGWVFTGGG